MSENAVIIDTQPVPRITPEEFQRQIEFHIRYSLGRDPRALSLQDLLAAVSLAVRNLLIDRLIETEQRIQQAGAKRVYYLSMEFLVGRSLGNNLYNLGIYDLCRDAVQRMGADLEEVREQEVDAALGNGGLGRLAACFLDSMATLDIPGFGYGINYEYGLFRQQITDGHQVESPDTWRDPYSPWLISRPGEECRVHLYGRVVPEPDRDGFPHRVWRDYSTLLGSPSDMPIVGYGGRTVNYLRLYSARAPQEFNFAEFSHGRYVEAVADKIAGESISKVLYPADHVETNRELRLVQEYFFVACALRDITRNYVRSHTSFDSFPDLVAIQLNDTHPALAVAELMRILMDEQRLGFDKAWGITRATLSYTNHTLMPEALETWPVRMIERVLPRHMEIVYEINKHFLREVEECWPGDVGRLARMSIVEGYGDDKRVRMAHLSIVGSHAVNGVAALHSELVKRTLVPDFHEMWPEKFSNKTNGVTPRRWLLKANPEFSSLISRTIGDGWITDLDQLRKLEPQAEDPSFQEQFLRIKRANKERLARVIRETTGVAVSPDSLFDVQAKRIHEYKRQLLNVMRIIHEYLCLVEDRVEPPAPKTYVFAGKAAPGYWAAKQIIKLVNDVAAVVNNDPRVRQLIRVVFIPDYRVSLAEKIIPAADISEHISTAGKEASGTSNMKFALNGALTVCTYDGANIEIIEQVGEENIYVFGNTAETLRELRDAGYDPVAYHECHPILKRVMDVFKSGKLVPGEKELFQWINNSVLNEGDPYFHLADLDSYVQVHIRAGTEFRDRALWSRKAVLNVARMGKFSSDRTIREYAEDIWNAHSV